MSKNFKKLSLFSALAFVGLIACKKDQEKDMAKLEVKKIPVINLDNMDSSIKPTDDFFNYVN